jgi:hypothetical protein
MSRKLLNLTLLLSLCSFSFGQNLKIEFIGELTDLNSEFNSAETKMIVDSIRGRNDIDGEFRTDSVNSFNPDYWDSGLAIFITVKGTDHQISISLNGCSYYNLGNKMIEIKLENIEGQGHKNQLSYTTSCGSLISTGFCELLRLKK